MKTYSRYPKLSPSAGIRNGVPSTASSAAHQWRSVCHETVGNMKLSLRLEQHLTAITVACGLRTTPYTSRCTCPTQMCGLERSRISSKVLSEHNAGLQMQWTFKINRLHQRALLTYEHTNKRGFFTMELLQSSLSNANFLEWWTGLGPRTWPPRSHDMTRTDFFSVGIRKKYGSTRPRSTDRGITLEGIGNSPAGMWVEPGTFEGVSQWLVGRVEAHTWAGCDHFEQLLWIPIITVTFVKLTINICS